MNRNESVQHRTALYKLDRVILGNSLADKCFHERAAGSTILYRVQYSRSSNLE